jgi:predicted nuclease of predicted toxin-antitoxin system
VKFLVDNQLPPALAQYLRKRGFDCQHVLDVGLAEALDNEICRYAEVQERIIVSKDEDFLYLATQAQSQIRLLWVRLGNCRTSALLAAFDRLWTLIESALNAGDRIIEIR